MNIRVVILWFTLLLAPPLWARESNDVLVMNNGDRLTCEVKGLDGGVLYVGLPYAIETMSVDWSKVAHLQSHQLFLVKMQDGSVYTGTLSTAEATAGSPIKIRVAVSPEKKVVLDSSQIVQVAETSEKFRRRFTGAVDLGVLYSKGNQTT